MAYRSYRLHGPIPFKGPLDEGSLQLITPILKSVLLKASCGQLADEAEGQRALEPREEHRAVVASLRGFITHRGVAVKYRSLLQGP